MMSESPDPLLGVPLGTEGPVGAGFCAEQLRRIGDPEILERAADQLMDSGLHPAQIEKPIEVLRRTASFARAALRTIEELGGTWDFETGSASFPAPRRGRRHDLLVSLVGLAFNELYPGTWKGRMDPQKLEKLRSRLFLLLPSEELTDEKLKTRLETYHDRGSAG